MQTQKENRETRRDGLLELTTINSSSEHSLTVYLLIYLCTKRKALVLDTCNCPRDCLNQYRPVVYGITVFTVILDF